MDPNENLRRQRELAKKLMNDSNADDWLEIYNELSELVLALDEWLSRGGFLPQAWAR